MTGEIGGWVFFCSGFGYMNTSSHSFVIFFVFGMAFNGNDGFLLCFGYDI
jgi:hypothetical protein